MECRLTELGFVLFLTVAMGGLVLPVTWAMKCGIEYRPLSITLVGGYGVLYGVVPLGAADLIAPRTYLMAGLVSLLGLSGFISGYKISHYGRATKGPSQSVVSYIDAHRPRLLIASIIIAATGFLVTVFSATTSIDAFLDAGRLGFRGSARSPVLMLIGTLMLRSLMVPPFLLTVASRRSRQIRGYVLALALAFLVYIAFDGTRSLAIGIIGSAGFGSLIGASLRRDSRSDAMSRAARLAGILAIGSIIVILAISTYEARSTLQDEGVASIGRAITGFDADPVQLAESEPLAYSRFLYRAVDVYPGDDGYLWLYPVRRTLFFFLPTGEIKPPDLNNIFAQNYPHLPPTTTLPPTLPGEGYISAGGPAGALVWLLGYGILVGIIEDKYRRSATAFLLLGTSTVETVVLGLRGQLYEQVVRMGTLAAVIWIILVASRLRMSRGEPAQHHVQRSSAQV